MAQPGRYQRQILLPEIGPEGQDRISRSSVALVGIGALGSVSADLLVRAGVGRVRLVDRDVVELGNLQRQVLFDEKDARESFPKAAAAERRLRQINSEIIVEGEAADLNPETIDGLLKGMDLVVDGTDNFESRFLVNDYCLREKLPWIYGGAVGTEGLTYVVLPGEGPCLRCLFEAPPGPGEFQTCDRAGILAPVAHWIASFQTMEALKILAGKRESVDRRLWKGDLWKKEFRALEVGVGFKPAPTGECSGCSRADYPYLNQERGSRTVTLCGRNAVQIFRSEKFQINFKNLAEKLSPFGAVQYNDYLLKASVSPFEITLFSNGRAIIQGTEDPQEAKGVYAKYIGA